MEATVLVALANQSADSHQLCRTLQSGSRLFEGKIGQYLGFWKKLAVTLANNLASGQTQIRGFKTDPYGFEGTMVDGL
jgi:hypothetical protein